MAKYKVGDTLRCLPRFNEKVNGYNDLEYGGSGYSAYHVFKVKNITDDNSDRPVYWPVDEDKKGNRHGVYENCLVLSSDVCNDYEIY